MLMQGVVFYVQEESALRLRADCFWVRSAHRNLFGGDLLLYHFGVGNHGPGLLVQRKKIDVITLSPVHMVQ